MAFQPAFVWGQGGQRMTPEEIARQRQIVDALMGQTDTSPVAHWTQGAARLVDALGTRLDENRLNNAEEQNAETNRDLMSALMGGLGGGSASPVASSPSVASALTAGPTETPAGQAINSRVASAHGGDMATYQDAIASIESAGSGNYSAIGPTHPELGRALGRYQVMEANVGPWSEAALGYSVTPEEFMASPEIQDAIFNHQFGQYVNQYGPEGAAQAWFGGPGGVGQTNRSDSLGTTIGEYGQKFNAALGGLPENPSHGQIVRGPDGQLYQNVEQLDGSWDWSRRAENFGAAQQPVQVAQAGGINPAIVQALTSPYADDSTRQMASILLEQQLQQNDPAAQLEMEIQREKLNQLRNPGPQELINAGRGRLYDPNTQQWLTAPDMGTDAPTVQTFYDETTGQSYKAQWNPSAGEWERVGGTEAPSGMSLRTNPDGSVEFVQGAGAGQKLTEMQGKDIGFYTRGMDANAQLQELGSELTDFTQQAAGNLPMGIGNYLRDPRFRQAKVAADQFLTALLRKDTGAAIVQSEFEIYGPMFLPMPGDDPDTLRQKERAREVALLAIRSGLGTAEAIGEANRIALGLPDEKLPSFTPSPSGKTSRDGEPTQLETLEIDENTVPEGVDPEDWKYMSEEDRALFR